MKTSCAKAIAEAWVRAYAREHGIEGAVFNGSITQRSAQEELPAASDVDINLLVETEDRAREKLGKLTYQGVLLDVSFLSLERILPGEKLLSTYEIAGAFRTPCIYDRAGVLAPLIAFVGENFAKPAWVQARCQSVFRKIRAGLDNFQEDRPLLDTVNPWLFPAGICTHAILVAALRNPTVRLRYLRAREVLQDERDIYEALLGLLGCRDMGRRRALEHLARLETIFDLAAARRRSAFPFQGDITPEARHVAIEGSRALMEAGSHREAIFWIAVTYERCLRILRADAPEAYPVARPALEELLADLGTETPRKAGERVQAIRRMLPALEAWTQARIASLGA